MRVGFNAVDFGTVSPSAAAQVQHAVQRLPWTYGTRCPVVAAIHVGALEEGCRRNLCIWRWPGSVVRVHAGRMLLCKRVRMHRRLCLTPAGGSRDPVVGDSADVGGHPLQGFVFPFIFLEKVLQGFEQIQALRPKLARRGEPNARDTRLKFSTESIAYLVSLVFSTKN